MTPEALYLQLGQLVAEMPNLSFRGTVPQDVNRWLGRAFALVEASSGGEDALLFKIASQGIGTALAESNAQTVAAIVHRALAAAELAAPAGIQGSFIPAGQGFDAFLAVGKVLGTARNGLLLVDPYADEKALEFALQASETVTIHVLADRGSLKPSLVPAAQRWAVQHSAVRPLEVRLAPARTLHDRVLIVDDQSVWMVGQSFNALAARSPTTISRVNDPEVVRMKIEAYAQLWGEATPAL